MKAKRSNFFGISKASCIPIAFCCLGHFCYVVIEKIYIYDRYSLAYQTTLWPSAWQSNNFQRISTAKLFQTC